MNRFYSQHGEDFLLYELFKHKSSGFFVEVGCIDGKRFSNTLGFEEMGWRGICVEAHSGYIDMLKKNRTQSIVFHCAAAEVDEEDAIFYANSRGSLSTLDPSHEEEWKQKHKNYFTGWEKQKVKKMRLDSIFEICQVQNIDILSLDIEGYEVEALKGINFKKYKPTVMVIESDSLEHRKALEAIIFPHGYLRIARLKQNLFYTTSTELATKIQNKIFKDVQLIYTEHPVDSSGDRIVTVTIDTRLARTIWLELKEQVKDIYNKLLKISAKSSKKNRS